MTSQEITRALKAMFPSPAHTFLSEVRNGTGFTRGPRTADAMVVSNFPSRGLWLAGIEIKCYLGDWKRELAQPEKAEAIQKYCHYWYVAVPKGLIQESSQIPETWGLIEVDAKCKAKVTIKPPRQEAKPIDMLMLASILRNVGESHVSKMELNDLADDKAKKLEDHRSTEFKQLKEAVAEFEKNAGISMRHTWEYGTIGEAVKFVIDSRINHRSDRLENMRTQAQMVVDSCDKILNSIKEPAPVADTVLEDGETE